MHVTLDRLIQILNARPLHVSQEMMTASCANITTDTRSLNANDAFVALRGENFDGHQFAAKAIASGAIVAIVDRPVSEPIPQLQVENTLVAYQKLGRWWRDRFDIPVIAITGSVGKTTTKELMAAVLATRGKVLKTKANYNNEIGVPKTLLELSAEHDFAVVEMAMRGRGQIAELTHIARPTIAVITNVGTAHIGLLGSREAIAQAKCELLAEMPADSVAVLNADNALLIETAKTVWDGKTVTFGLESGDLRGDLLDSETLKVGEQVYPLPLSGKHNALNFLAAIAVADLLDIDRALLQKKLTVSLPDGRAKRYELPGDLVLLDETYNAGLESMLAALDLLAQTPGTRKIAVLGTMKELGDRSLEFHRQVGEKARDLNLDALFIYADRPEAEAMAAGATGIPTIEVRECGGEAERQNLASEVQIFLKPGDRLLLKASHSVRLDAVVDRLLATLKTA